MQPNVPWWFAAAIVVAQAMLTFAIVNATQVHLGEPVLYLMGVISIGLTTLATVLNIKSPGKP